MKWRNLIIGALPPVVISGVLGYLWKAGAMQAPAPASTPAPTVVTAPAESPVQVPDKALPREQTAEEPQPAEQVLRDQKPVVAETPGTKPEQDFLKLFKEGGAAVSRHPQWLALVNRRDGLWLLVKSVEQVANGNRPLALAACLPVGTAWRPFSAVKAGGAWRSSPAAEGRFAVPVEVLCSLDVTKAAALVGVLEPELNRMVREELGYPPETTFRSLLFEAMEVLLKTPMLTEAPRLERIHSFLYRFEQPELEALNHAQKLLLRMGVEHHRKVAHWLRSFWKAL